MNLSTLSNLVTLFGSAIVVAICVALHYEAMRFLGRTLGHHVHKRSGVMLVMLGLLAAHVLEIWVFALGYLLAEKSPGFGYIHGLDNSQILDYVYYSSVVYTTLGFGDMLPQGHIRMLSAAESLAGLALITWSASFTFLAMQRFWPKPIPKSNASDNPEDSNH